MWWTMSEAGGHYCCKSKKTDEICGGLCGQDSEKLFGLSRFRCILHCINLKKCIPLFTFIPTCIFLICIHGNEIAYLLRPLLESPPLPFHEIPHYYHQNISMDKLCNLHGWKLRQSPRRVYDAVLFSNELDLLTIRWKELHPYVTKFILLESNSTFTGFQKPLVFSNNRDQFQFVESRLVYNNTPGRLKTLEEDPFVGEAYQRLELDQLIKSSGISDDDLLIMSDVDEIPSRHTVNLLRWCEDVPEILHLRMKNYLYSFEFLVDDHSWTASVHRYKTGKTKYSRFRQSDDVLADAGWHCSFCFRHISEFMFKMRASRHSDRMRASRYWKRERIQRVICKGTDLFDMLPAGDSLKEIIGKMGAVPHSFSAIHLPAYLLEKADEFKFLLPGNCQREQTS